METRRSAMAMTVGRGRSRTPACGGTPACVAAAAWKGAEDKGRVEEAKGKSRFGKTTARGAMIRARQLVDPACKSVGLGQTETEGSRKPSGSTNFYLQVKQQENGGANLRG